MILKTTDFDGSPVNGCKLVGTHYTCHGWDNVTIVGDLTTSGGHTVDVFGGNDVFVAGESNVSPEIVLDIQTLLDYSQPMLRANNDNIEQFCTSTWGEGFPSYEANKPSKSALAEYEAFHAVKQTQTGNYELLSVNLYPVPATNILYLNTTESISNEQIIVVDVSGRTIQLPVSRINDRNFEINISELSAGSYYLNLSSNEGQSNKMFTVNNH